MPRHAGSVWLLCARHEHCSRPDRPISATKLCCFLSAARPPPPCCSNLPHLPSTTTAIMPSCLQDLPSSTGTWINGKQLRPGQKQLLLPQDMLQFGAHPASEVYRVKMQHVSLSTGGLNGHSYTVIPVGSQAHSVKPSGLVAA